MAKGKGNFEKFKNGGVLTRSQAIAAKCYDCNGGDGGNCDCEVDICPLYPYMYYNPKKRVVLRKKKS